MFSIVPHDPYVQKRISTDDNSSTKRLKVIPPANNRRIAKMKGAPEDFDLKISLIVGCILDNDLFLGVRVNLLHAWFDHQNLPIPEKLKTVKKSKALILPEEGDKTLHLAIRMNDFALVRLIISKGSRKPHEQNSKGETAYEVASAMSYRYKNHKIINALKLCKVDYENLQFSKLVYIQNFISTYPQLVEIFIRENKRFQSNNTFMHLYFSFKFDRVNFYQINSNSKFIDYLLNLDPDLTLQNDENLTPYEMAIFNFPRPSFCILIDYMKLKGQKIKVLKDSPEQPKKDHETFDDPKHTFKKIKSYLVDQPIFTHKDVYLDDNISAKILTYLDFKDQAEFAQTCYRAYDQVNERRWMHLQIFKFNCNKHLATYKLAELFSRLKHISGQTHYKEISNLSALFEKIEKIGEDLLTIMVNNNGGNRDEYEHLKLMFNENY